MMPAPARKITMMPSAIVRLSIVESVRHDAIAVFALSIRIVDDRLSD